MICIDSDCIIDFLKDKKEAIEVIAEYREEMVTTEINIFEVFLGIYSLKKQYEKEEELAESFFDSLEVLSIDGWGRKSAKIFTDLIKQEKVIELNDCFIAAIMIINGCNKIITNNVEHFSRIKDIEVITY